MRIPIPRPRKSKRRAPETQNAESTNYARTAGNPQDNQTGRTKPDKNDQGGHGRSQPNPNLQRNTGGRTSTRRGGHGDPSDDSGDESDWRKLGMRDDYLKDRHKSNARKTGKEERYRQEDRESQHPQREETPPESGRRRPPNNPRERDERKVPRDPLGGDGGKPPKKPPPSEPDPTSHSEELTSEEEEPSDENTADDRRRPPRGTPSWVKHLSVLLNQREPQPAPPPEPPPRREPHIDDKMFGPKYIQDALPEVDVTASSDKNASKLAFAEMVEAYCRNPRISKDVLFQVVRQKLGPYATNVWLDPVYLAQEECDRPSFLEAFKKKWIRLMDGDEFNELIQGFDFKGAHDAVGMCLRFEAMMRPYLELAESQDVKDAAERAKVAKVKKQLGGTLMGQLIARHPQKFSTVDEIITEIKSLNDELGITLRAQPVESSFKVLAIEQTAHSGGAGCNHPILCAHSIAAIESQQTEQTGKAKTNKTFEKWDNKVQAVDNAGYSKRQPRNKWDGKTKDAESTNADSKQNKESEYYATNEKGDGRGRWSGSQRGGNRGGGHRGGNSERQQAAIDTPTDNLGQGHSAGSTRGRGTNSVRGNGRENRGESSGNANRPVGGPSGNSREPVTVRKEPVVHPSTTGHVDTEQPIQYDDSNMKCHLCDTMGHRARNCPARAKQAARRKAQRICTNCEGNGHYASECTRDPLRYPTPVNRGEHHRVEEDKKDAANRAIALN